MSVKCVRCQETPSVSVEERIAICKAWVVVLGCGCDDVEVIAGPYNHEAIAKSALEALKDRELLSFQTLPMHEVAL